MPAATAGSSAARKKQSVMSPPKRGISPCVDPPGVVGDARARALAEDVLQPRDGEALGAQQVGEHVARAHARELVGIADQQQVGAARDGLDELVGEQRVQHADLVDDDQVGLQRVVGVRARLAARPQLQHAVQRPRGQARRLLHPLGQVGAGGVADLLGERQQALVDDQRPVAGVARDVADVARAQADVERVQDEPAARDPEVRLEVLVVVPAERRNPVAALEAEPTEPDGELLRPSHHVRVRVAVEGAVGEARDDLLRAEVRLDAAQDRRQRQLVVHHQAVHRPSFARSNSRS